MFIFPVTNTNNYVNQLNKKYPVYTSRHLIKLYNPTENTCVVVTNPDEIPLDFYIGKHEITSSGRPVKLHFVLDRNDYSSPNRLDEVIEFVIVYLKKYLEDYSHVFQEIPNFKKEDFCITYTYHDIEIVFKNYFYFNNITSNNRILIDMMRLRDDIFFQYKYTSICKNTLAISDEIQYIHALIHYIPNDHERKCISYK